MYGLDKMSIQRYKVAKKGSFFEFVNVVKHVSLIYVDVYL